MDTPKGTMAPPAPGYQIRAGFKSDKVRSRRESKAYIRGTQNRKRKKHGRQ